MSNDMPKMPKEKYSLPGEAETSPQEEVKQTYIKPGEDLNSEVKVPLVPRKGIDVTATRKGFYGQLRVKSGDKFVVKNLESLGTWMKCDDPDWERKRIKFLENKNKKAKK